MYQLDRFFSWALENYAEGEAKLSEILPVFKKCYPEYQEALSLLPMARFHMDFRPVDKNELNQLLAYNPQKKVVLQREYYFSEGNKESSFSMIGNITVHTHTAQGPRPQIEDTYLAAPLHLNRFASPSFILGVFDGHGGDECATFVSSHLKETLEEAFNYCLDIDDQIIYNTLTTTCVKLDKKWKETSFKKCGTTACFVVKIHENLWCTNVGDSGAIVFDDTTVTLLSEEAKPTQEKYKKEILQRGGAVIEQRVDGALDMARSIGDPDHPSVSARPTIQKTPFIEGNSLLVACDGLWDVIDVDAAADILRARPLPTALQDLSALAYAKGSTDNVTLLAARL